MQPILIASSITLSQAEKRVTSIGMFRKRGLTLYLDQRKILRAQLAECYGLSDSCDIGLHSFVFVLPIGPLNTGGESARVLTRKR